MVQFIKVDGKWFNPEHIMMIHDSPSKYPGFSRVTLVDGTVVAVALKAEQVIQELCR